MFRRQSMKKTAILITLVLCLFGFAACGTTQTEPTSDDPITSTPAASEPITATPSASAADVGSNIAIVIHGKEYPVELCNIYYASTYYDFLNIYGEYASMLGLDTSTGLSGLKEQSCDYSEDGTWYGYFRESAMMMLEQSEALCDYAATNGITLSEELSDEIEAFFQNFDALSVQNGFADHNEYLSVVYGPGVDDSLYRTYLETTTLADYTYQSYYDGLSFTEQEIDENYALMGYAEGENEYPVTAMRHILVMAEPDENGVYTEEAIAEAHHAAEALYEQWKNGDCTEESFAKLANTHSDDSVSTQNGGLYENIFQGQMVPGINEWLFEEERAEGDTALIDNNGSYVGTHIVYFVGTGELYSRILSLEDLRTAELNGWFSALMQNYSAAKGPAFDNIGIF